ncbi:MAG: CHAT domain-containing protein [Proteobacteria bacterium]|nr:CHAT domain-containing protein [Pseudomonadota bacterium]
MTLLALLASLAFAQPAPPEPCADLFGPEAEGRDPGRCVYMYARRSGDYDGAIAFMATVVDARPDWAWSRLTLGNLRMDHGEVDGAWTELERAADAFREAEIPKGEVFARLNLTQLAGRNRRVEDVREQLDRAVDVATLSGDDSLQRIVLSQRLRTMWQHKRDLDLTLSRAQALHEQLTPEDDYQTRLVALHVMIQVAAELQRDDVWLTAYPKLLTLLQENDDAYAESMVRTGILQYLSARPHLQERVLDGRDFVEEALAVADLARKGDNPWTEVDTLYRAALVSDDEATARAFVERARKVGVSLEEAYYLPGLEAAWAAKLSEWDPEEGLALAESLGALDATLNLESRAAKARFVAHHRLGNRVERAKEAEAFRSVATEIFDLGVDNGRSWRADWDADFHDLAWVVAEDGDLAAAHEILESTRAQAVRSALDRSDVSEVLIDDVALRERYQKARTRLEGAEEDLGYATEADLAEAAAALQAAREEVAHIVDELNTSAPEYAALRRTKPVELSAIQARLGPDEAVVTFQLPVQSAEFAEPWAMVIRADEVRSYPLPPLNQLDERVRLFAGMHGVSGVAGARLYDELLGPAFPDGPPSKLTVIPEGPLYGLPFAALRATAESPPLGAAAQVVQAPSVSLWARWSEVEPAADGAVVAFADPTFGEDAVLLRVDKMPPRLDQAAAEVEALRGLDAQIFVGAEASETGWLPTNPRLVHFAAHAVVPSHDPGSAGLLLAPGEGTDGWLSTGEIVAEDLNGAVVVLSACQSAGGGVVGAQGPEGLAPAFQQAGASAVLATLWPLRDDHARGFAVAFYGFVDQGQSLGQALQSAQSLMHDAGHAPEGWAGIVLIGNPDVVLKPGGTAPTIPWWPLAVVFAGAIGLGIARSRA